MRRMRAFESEAKKENGQKTEEEMGRGGPEPGMSIAKNQTSRIMTQRVPGAVDPKKKHGEKKNS